MVGAIEGKLIGAALKLSLDSLKSFIEGEIDRNSNLRLNLIVLESSANNLHDMIPQLISSTDSACQQLLTKLIEWCYDVRDLLDTVELAKMKQRIRDENSSKSDPWNFGWGLGCRSIMPSFPSSDSTWHDPRLTSKVDKLLKNLELLQTAIKSRSKTFRTEQQNEDVRSCNNQELPDVPDAMFLPCGRSEDKQRIVRQLLGNADGVHNYRGVSIIGMPGLGKSVLALSIVLDKWITNHFHTILWASPATIRGDIEPYVLQSVRPRSKNQSVRKLIVLDSLEYEALERCDFENPIMAKHIGKEDTALITSRDPRVARPFRTVVYNLMRMSSADCAQLIELAPFHPQLSDPERDFLKERARGIADKCMGLPLATWVVVRELRARRWSKGGIEEAIRSLDNPQVWKKLRGRILQALRLDDQRLQRHWNKLVYLVLFPHWYALSKENLVRLWMGEGFIQLDDMEMQFSDMLPTSLIEPLCSEHFSNEDPCTSVYRTNEITDMLAQSMPGNLSIRVDDTCSEQRPCSSTRHLSLSCTNVDEHLLQGMSDSKVGRMRTFFMLPTKKPNPVPRVPYFIWQKFRRLRVLDLSGSGIEIVLSSISNLKLLRYLDLSNTGIRGLPDTLCDLFGLMVLKLLECPNLKKLPPRIGKLSNLIHLELDELSSCALPQKIGKLTNLQTLHAFPVDRDPGCLISELQNLNALCGSLKIRQLENVKDGKEAAEAALHKKPDLRILSLEWTKSQMPEPSIAEDILNRLKPHRNLVQIRVTNYSGHRFPTWFTDSSYENLHLKYCPNISSLPPLCKLRRLKVLHIEAVCQLESISRDFFGDDDRFKSLESLTFREMQQLSVFQGFEPGDMPSLRKLKFDRCRRLTMPPTALEHLTCLMKLDVEGCDSLPRFSRLPKSLKEYHHEGRCLRIKR